MVQVKVAEAKAQLSSLLDAVEAGEAVAHREHRLAPQRTARLPSVPAQPSRQGQITWPFCGGKSCTLRVTSTLRPRCCRQTLHGQVDVGMGGEECRSEVRVLVADAR